jgi:hypothetical protein
MNFHFVGSLFDAKGSTPQEGGGDLGTKILLDSFGKVEVDGCLGEWGSTGFT